MEWENDYDSIWSRSVYAGVGGCDCFSSGEGGSNVIENILVGDPRRKNSGDGVVSGISRHSFRMQDVRYFWRRDSVSAGWQSFRKRVFSSGEGAVDPF